MKKKRNILVLLLIIVTVGLFLSGCNGDTSNTANTATMEITAEPTTEPTTDVAASMETTHDIPDTEGTANTDAVAAVQEATAQPAATLEPGKTVSKITLGQNPDKIAYVSGEDFSLEGGTIIVTFTDGTTQELPMTADCFQIKEPGMTASGTKTVTVRCESKSTRFVIQVANKSFAVVYNQNYAGEPMAETVDVVKGQLAEDKVPIREGYTFIAWYMNEDFTQQYDFTQPVTRDLNLYALWIKTNADTVTVTFDYDYYGVKLNEYSYPIESDTSVVKPVNDPLRQGYTFSEWLDVEGNPYDFSKTVTQDTTIKASWTKAVAGMQTYVFEAEDTSLVGKTGPAISGTANETGMIIPVKDRNCSNDYCVGYLYKYGLSLEFYFASDEAVDDATIYLSLSAEMSNLILTPDMYGVYLNNSRLEYATVVIDDVPEYNATTYVADCAPFRYYMIADKVSLQKGANVIKLVTENNEAYSGTTMLAHAPLVDALRIDTEGVLIWDENFGVPVPGNYSK